MLVIKGDGVRPSRHEDFSRFGDDRYAVRFLRHLRDDPATCSGCADACTNCRAAYGLDRSGDVEVLEVPSSLSLYPESVSGILPEKLPACEALVALNIHEDIVLDAARKAVEGGFSLFILPAEAPHWNSPWLRRKVSEIGREGGMECSFPKPFCDMAAEPGSAAARFIEHFHIGRPDLTIGQRGGRIISARVNVSAPCGCTYYVAHYLLGRPVDESIVEAVSKSWHSYPCTASMKMDQELGDTILHEAGYIHRRAVLGALGSRSLSRYVPAG